MFNLSRIDVIVTFFMRLLIVFTILPIHEYAHAYSARKLGDNTALIAGRLTLNPLAHIDPIGAIFLLLFGFGWAKPVPVNPRNFKNYKRDCAIVAAAGPLSNLICAVIFIFLQRIAYNVMLILHASDSVIIYTSLIFSTFATINLSLAVFNLLPITPLDGSNILAYFLPPKANAFLYRHAKVIQIVLLLVVFLGLLSGPLSWIISKLYKLINTLFVWVDFMFSFMTR